MDFTRVESLCAGNRDFERRWLTTFLDDLERRRADIETAMAEGDLEALRRHAHTVKGSSANLGADALSHAAGELERTAASGNAELLAQLFCAFAVECQAARHALERYRDRSAGEAGDAAE